MPSARKPVMWSLLICVLMPCAVARAVYKSWSNPVSGNWNDGTKWSPAGTPVAGDNVAILSPGIYTVTVNVNTPVLGNVSIGNPTGIQSIILGPPGGNPSKWLSSAGTVALNVGARVSSNIDDDARIILNGPTAELVMEGGSIDLSAGRFIIAGGHFHYVSGEIGPVNGPYSLNLQGDELYGSALTNTVNLNLIQGLTVNLNLSNAGTLTVDPAGGANSTCNGMLHNLPAGTLRVPRGTFTCNLGFVNDGMVILSAPPSRPQLTVRGGSLFNNNTITVAPGNGAVIDAQLINAPGALLEDAGSGIPPQLVGASVHQVNQGTIRGGGWEFILSGVDPIFTQDGGTIDMLGGNATFSGGTFVYLSGAVTGGGSLTMSGVQLTGNPYTNSGNLYLSNGCVCDWDLNNSGYITDPSNGAMPTFNGAFRNLATGLLRIQTGNSNSNYTFNAGLENFGTITTGSFANGAATLVVSGGPLRNHGIINTANANGGERVIRAELINEPDGLLETTDGIGVTLRLEKPVLTTSIGAASMRTRPWRSWFLAAASSPTRHQARFGATNASLTITGDASPTSVPWVTSNGTLESVDPESNFVIIVPAGRQFVNNDSGQVVVNGGTFHVSNGGRFHNGGLLCVNPGGRLLNTGTVADNYDAATQTWTGGRMKITGPGEVCYPVANGSIHVLETTIGCIHETVTCTSGGAGNLFGGLQKIGATGAFELDGMTMSTAGNFENDNLLSVVNGATLTVPGILSQMGGTITVSDSTINAATTMVMSGSIQGNGNCNSDVQNHGHCRPGQSPGRFKVTGHYTQAADGALDIEVAGLVQQTSYDILEVTQGATLGGALNVSVIDGFNPDFGQSFDIVTAASIQSTFATFNPPLLSGGRCWSVEYMPDRVRLHVAPRIGDMNCDCAVNALDIDGFILALIDPDAYATAYAGCNINRADMNADTLIDGADIRSFINNVISP